MISKTLVCATILNPKKSFRPHNMLLHHSYIDSLIFWLCLDPIWLFSRLCTVSYCFPRPHSLKDCTQNAHSGYFIKLHSASLSHHTPVINSDYIPMLFLKTTGQFKGYFPWLYSTTISQEYTQSLFPKTTQYLQ